MTLCFVINSISVKFARFKIFRHLGTKVYYKHYPMAIYYGTLKLYLESYFDLTMGIMMGLSAFEKYGLHEFFQSRDDIFCSFLTFVFAVFALLFPLSVRYYLVKNFEGTLEPEKVKYLEVFYSNCHGKTMKSNLYEFYFLFRRFLSMSVIIFMQI